MFQCYLKSKQIVLAHIQNYGCFHLKFEIVFEKMRGGENFTTLIWRQNITQVELFERSKVTSKKMVLILLTSEGILFCILDVLFEMYRKHEICVHLVLQKKLQEKDVLHQKTFVTKRVN